MPTCPRWSNAVNFAAICISVSTRSNSIFRRCANDPLTSCRWPSASWREATANTAQHRLFRRGAQGAECAFLAGQRSRTGPCGRARGAALRSGSDRAPQSDVAVDGRTRIRFRHDPASGRTRKAGHRAGPGALRRGRQRGSRSTRPEPQCDVPKAGEIQDPQRFRADMSGVRLERRIWLSLLAVAAFTALAAAVMTQAVARQDLAWPMSAAVPAGVFLALGLTLLWLVRRLADWIMRPLAGASTVVEALRDGDFSLRLRETHLGPLDELAHSINMLAESMRVNALNRRESGLLLGKILEEIDLPVLAFRDDGHLTLSNPAARKLIGLRLHEGVDAASLGLADLLEQPGRLSEGARSTRLVFPGGSGRFVVRRRSFRLGGVPHRLLVLAEVGSVLSAERNEAWQSLVRVMSHEINNSLSPIKSLPRPGRRAFGIPRARSSANR